MPRKHMLRRFKGPSLAASFASAALVGSAVLVASAAPAVAGAPAATEQSSSSQLQQITVQAAHDVQRKQVGMSYTGVPIEEVSLSRHVGFSDLDLSTPAGKDELDKRIKDVAKEACIQLKKLYPLEQWNTDNRTCVANAVENAMAQERTVLASVPRK